MKYMVTFVKEKEGIMFAKHPEIKTGSVVMCETEDDAKKAVAMFGSDAKVYEVKDVGFGMTITIGGANINATVTR